MLSFYWATQTLKCWKGYLVGTYQTGSITSFSGASPVNESEGKKEISAVGDTVIYTLDHKNLHKTNIYNRKVHQSSTLRAQSLVIVKSPPLLE